MVIRTPDYRLRVFVSSTLRELAEERDAVRQAIMRLHLAPVMFELGARPHPAEDVYRAYLSQSHVFIGLYWQSYGWRAPGQSTSGLEDEYDRSGGMPRLLYIKAPAPDREPALTRLLSRIRDENTGCYKSFATPDELAQLVENDLALLLTERFEAARIEKPADSRGEARPGSNVPHPRNPLIGRTREMKTACDLLKSNAAGLVTLTGPGGCGKSRLAIQIALELRDHFPDGVFLVALESITDAGMVVPIIAKTVGVPQGGAGTGLLESLSTYLCERQVLLLLDNFEHVLGAGPEIAALLEACPRTKILATSRAPLRLRAEKELPVPPLPLPPPGQELPPAQLLEFAAVRLFVERAQAVRPDFQLDQQNGPIITGICQRLDGLPLALELAAARIRLLPPEMLLQELERSLEVLHGGTRDLPSRQQTLERAIAWSFNLLGPPEQALLRRLSVFSGGCTVEAVEAVCVDESLGRTAILDGLSALVDISLVAADDHSGSIRFRMLETIRQFARDQLLEHEPRGQVRRAHFDYYLSLADQLEKGAKHQDAPRIIGRIETEVDNFRTALDWAVGAGEPRLALQLIARFTMYWKHFLPLKEGRDRLQRILAAVPEPCAERAAGLCQLGVIGNAQGDYAFARTILEQALTVSEALGDQYFIARSMFLLAWVLFSLGESDRSRQLIEQSLELFRAQNLPDEEAHVLMIMGERARAEGDLVRARELDERALALLQPGNDKLNMHLLLGNVGMLLIHFRELEQSETYLRQGLTMALETRSVNYHFILLGFAFLANARGEAIRAVRILGAATGLLKADGRVIDTGDRPDYEENLASLRKQLDAKAFDKAWSEGGAMTKEQATEYALQSDSA